MVTRYAAALSGSRVSKRLRNLGSVEKRIDPKACD